MASTNRAQRRVAIALSIALSGALLVGAAVTLDGAARAEIEGGTFTSEADNVRMTLPPAWRISDQPSYPGIVLRMFRTRPRGTILLAIDPRPDAIDEACRTRPAATPEGVPIPLPIEQQIACQQARRLSELGFTVTEIKEAARPYFDYSTKDRELRQGVVVLDDRVLTLVLATDTAAARAQYARTFDKALRSLRPAEARDRAEDAGDADDASGAPADAPTPAPAPAPSDPPAPR